MKNKSKPSMLTLSNTLSFSRAPLACLFLIENTFLRISVIILAMITDAVDGFLARRSQSTTRFGAVLDPAMDKFFVYFILILFFLKGKVLIWEMLAMVSRDFALALFGLYLLGSGNWRTFEVKAVRWGKITTSVQFLVLIGLTLNITFPSYLYFFFIIAGLLTSFELFTTIKTNAIDKQKT